MKKVGNPNSILKTLFFSLALMVTMNVTAYAQEAPPAEALLFGVQLLLEHQLLGAEVMENGIELGNMQSVLLKKIEELTLYTLKQQDEIEALKQTIEELKGK